MPILRNISGTTLASAVTLGRAKVAGTHALIEHEAGRSTMTPSSNSREMFERVHAFDWGSTPLGPMSAWAPRLRAIVDLMLASPQATYVAWGPELTSLYNDAYMPILGSKHPDGLGQPFKLLFAEIWDEYRPSSIEPCRENDSISSIVRCACCGARTR